MRGILGVFWGLALSVSAVWAEGFGASTSLRPLETANDSKGWEAVGRLNFGDRAYCTGAMIADDIVLTAAHCLFDPTTGILFEPDEIEFLAGWRNGRAASTRSVIQYVAHPEFTFSEEDRIGRVANDIAVLRLHAPIRNPGLLPYSIDVRPRKGAEVSVVSYARDRAEFASIQEACRVLARQGGVLVLNCDIDHGSSGSPIFVTDEDGGVRIVSVVSAMAQVRGNDVALGTSLSKTVGALLERLHSADPPTVGAIPVRSRSLPAVDTSEDTSGAKFIKPGL